MTKFEVATWIFMALAGATLFGVFYYSTSRMVERNNTSFQSKKDDEHKAMEVCLQQGGIPKFSYFKNNNNGYESCQFKEDK